MADQEPAGEHRANLDAPDERSRVAAVRACARARDTGALEKLRRMAGEDASVEVRYQARVALSVLREAGSGDRRKPNWPSDPSAADLRGSLGAADPAERTWALREAVLHEEAPSLLPAVLARVEREHDADVRAQLVTTLAEMGGADMRDHIARFMQDADARVRANAVEAAETLGDAKLEPLVVKALQDNDHRVKLNAVTYLDHAGKLSLVKCCAQMMRDKHYWVRDAAAYSLATARQAEAVPHLARALLDPHEPVRNKARDGLQALVEAGVAEARDALAHPGAAAEPSTDATPVTEAADEGAIPQLLERLKTETEVRTTARLLTVLASIGNPVIAPIIVEYLNHPSLEVSRLAEVSLQRLGAEHLIPKGGAGSGGVGKPRAEGEPAAAPPAPQTNRPSGSTPTVAGPGGALINQRPGKPSPQPPVSRPAEPPPPASDAAEPPAKAPVVPTFHPGPTKTHPAPNMVVPALLVAALICVVFVLLR